MFRSRKKKDVKDAAEGAGRASSDIEPTPTIKSSKTFRLGKKKEEPEPKLELDIEHALPPSDDFRTSLLMSGLSARFSMLREQDDPTSKIGKASDDSVLFPKRSSKLIDFGFQAQGLSDIAEVSSIHGSVHRPLAFSRTDSYADGYGTDDESTHTGSMMSRPKPGEGNNLFGGRQKVYKIPAGSKGLADRVGLGGRVLYDNDVSKSAFQKLREKEKESRWEERNDDEDNNADITTAEHSRAGSPPPAGYNPNRETSSTTSSGHANTRISTSATSVTSQRTPSLSGSHTPGSAGGSITNSGMERPTNKMRRLYETGLDQHVHDQQHSTMNRIDSLTRQRGMGAQTPPLAMNSPTSTTSFNAADKWDRKPVLAQGSMPNLRAASPPPNYNLPSPISGFDFGPVVKSSHLTVEPKSQYGFSNPPLSPPVSENDEAAPISQVNDRVKAILDSAPPKSGQQDDENKNYQNQFQMRNEKETPPPRKHSPPGPFIPRQQLGLRLPTDSSATQQTFPGQRHFPPKDRAPELQSPKQQQIINPGSENVSAPSPTVGSPTIRSIVSPDRSDFFTKGPMSRPWGLPQPRSFPNLRYRNHNDPLISPRPDESQHPANQPSAPAPQGPQQPLPAPPSSPPMILEIKTTPPDDGDREFEPPADSPTLPLSGMVRSHLRSDSDSSSIYGITSPGFSQPISSNPNEQPHDYDERRTPWDINDWDERPASLVKADSAVPAPLTTKSMDSDTEAESTPKAAWEMEMGSHHNRNGSSATQQELQEFKDELAQRRRQVQENLKSLVIEPERQPERQVAPPTPGSAVLLKTKASLGALAMKQKEAAGQSKAMKMFGMGSSPVTQNVPPQPFKQRIDDNSWKEEEEEMLRNVATSSTPPQIKAFRQARRDAQRDREHQIAMRHQQNGEDGFNEITWSNPRPIDPRQAHPYESRQMQGTNDAPHPRGQSRERKPPPVTHSQRNANRESKGSIGTNHSGSRPASRTSRDRSGSDASGRSKSRNGLYRDDLAKAMAEGTGISNQGVVEDLQNARLMLKPTVSGVSPGSSPGLSPGFSGRSSPLTSPAMGSNPRSNSKAAPSSYFEPQNMHALQTGDALEIGISPRPSPVTPFSVNPTPSLVDPSPIGPRSTTPTAFQANGRIAARKKSVTKSEISEPTFISSTSRISTINLPPGSSLQNGIPPPIPAVNPRRKQTRAMFGAILGRKNSSEYIERNEISLATQSSEEMSTFSEEEANPKEKQRQKLRKSSSEGGNLNVKAREKAYNVPSPAMPDFPPGFGGVRGPTPVQDGSMF